MSDPARENSRHEQFMALFLRHQARVYSYIRSMVLHRADAQEIMQEVALVLWRRFDEFEPGSHFDRWACRVAFHQVRYFFQKKHRHGLVFSSELMETIADDAAAVGRNLDPFRDALEECVGQLPPHDRDLLHRRYKEDATNRTVARDVGRSESAVSRALSRIYESLLHCIQGKTGIVGGGGAAGGSGGPGGPSQPGVAPA